MIGKIETIKEYGEAGRYRIRKLARKGVEYMDIREYIVSEQYEGFTRRGVEIRSREEAQTLISALQDAFK